MPTERAGQRATGVHSTRRERPGVLLLLAVLGLGAGCTSRPAAPVPPWLTPAAATDSLPQPPASYPPTPRRQVVMGLHGLAMSDDYQWLEDGEDPEVQEWTAAQSALARGYLDALPDRALIRQRVAQILESSSPDHYALREAGGRLFALALMPPKPQALLVTLSAPDELASERVLLDPSAVDPSGSTTIDFYVPSPDGRLVAVSLSRGGTENGTVQVLDTATGKPTGDVVPYVNSGTAGGSLTWSPDGRSFLFTRHPRPGERPPEDLGFFQQIYLHTLGAPESQDRYSLGRDFPRTAMSELHTSEAGGFVHLAVQHGDGAGFAHYLKPPNGEWLRFAEPTDEVTRAAFAPDGTLALLSLKGAPRGALLRLDPTTPELGRAQVVVAEGDAPIQWYLPTRSKLYVADQLGGPSRIRVFERTGELRGMVPLPPVCSVRQLVRSGDDDLLVRVQSYTEPPTWYRYRPGDGALTATALRVTAPVTFADAEVVRESCVSRDGTRVPLTILRRKGIRLDGTSIAMLTGYGGFGISHAPKFDGLQRIWLDQGGLFAVAHIRGGGELGEAWHKAGMLTRKQNVFDDFAACAERLFETGHTRPDRLVITGASNGGLLMGAALTQHPEKFRAVASLVGIYDMLRVELTPNGAFNATEYGSVSDPEQFRALLAYSPYHHVRDGVAYPATLLITGENDPRVDPFHSRKMAARLQAATAAAAPILLSSSAGRGHGIGAPLDAAIEQHTDVLAFLLAQLEVRLRPP